jgi:hypothetical protein
MARFAIIDAWRVINHAEADEAFAQSQGWIPAGDSRIGDLWDGEVFTPAPPEPEPVPESCTPAQGLVALFAVKQITEDQLLAAIDQIPDEVQRYTARIGLQRATTWERTSPTMQALAALLGLTEQDLDDLYTLAVTVVV